MEAALLKKLKYVDGILHLLDVITKHPQFILVLERPTESVDLFQYITDKGRLEEQEAINFMKQIVSTLIDVDELDIYHGDIKDQNIIVDMSSLKLSIIDFGSGDFYPSDNILYSYDGTPVYCCPEWFSQRRCTADGLTIWSLGILFYDMLYGDVPFQYMPLPSYELTWPEEVKINEGTIMNLLKSRKTFF